MRIDLHCHSKYSKRPTLWLMQKLGCPESFTEPAELFELLRRKGMDAVTITDHNVIDGALEIAGLDNTFVSCEYTTYFPSDHCKVHILAYDITETHHREITEARENIFDLVDYFHAHNIVHVCAHPLFWVNDKLTIEHVEQLILLFKNWEVNGDLSKAMNDAVLDLVTNLTAQDIDRLADKHGVTPRHSATWVKNITSGSDDHSSLNLGHAHTEVDGAATLAEFWAGIASGRARTRVQEATPKMLARNYYGIAYQFYRDKLGLERNVCKDVSLRFMDQTLKSHLNETESLLARIHLRLTERRAGKRNNGGEHTLFELARIEAEKHIRADARLMALMRDGHTDSGCLDSTWFELVDHLSNQLLVNVGTRLIDRLVKAHLFEIFQSAGSAAALYLLLAPYFVSYALFARERMWSNDVLAALKSPNCPVPRRRTPRVADFTDTYHEVNGVARTLQQQLATAQELGKDYRIITCRRPTSSDPRGLHQFAPVGSYALPEYEELELLVPPFLKMLNHCYEEDYTHIHLSTPGTVGLAGLAIARILKLPVSGTYHTSLPQYAKTFTEDGYVEDLVWRYMVWFYNQMDVVYVPSKFTGDELAAKGIDPERIRIYPRGIDINHFHPSKRDRSVYQKIGIDDKATIVLSVGRVSKEKGLDVLAKAFRQVVEQRPNLQLVIVGDGPYRAEMESNVVGLPVTFAGYREGEELAALYASADFLVMPSITDTFGNVVLEAQASGIPVIVCNGSATMENVVPDQTGLPVEPNDVADLRDAMATLAEDCGHRSQLGRNARTYMESRGFQQAFDQMWDLYVTETVPRETSIDIERIIANGFTAISAKAS